jgi:flavin reductase (DIM6/NTAB) family NADH-FMN oxidoreductase RutF
VPPIAMWHKISTDEGANGAPLLVGALGWLECVLDKEVAAGTHTFFVFEVRRVELGEDAPALIRVRGEYKSV